MKKFRFRLERILQLKAHIEKEKQKFLALSVHKVANQENLLKDIAFSRIENQNQQRQFLLGKISTSLMSIFSRYYLHLKKNELSGRELLEVYRKEQERKRQDLAEATKGKRIYEKLRERRLENYYKEYERVSQKEQDELASQMLFHKKKSQSR